MATEVAHDNVIVQYMVKVISRYVNAICAVAKHIWLRSLEQRIWLQEGNCNSDRSRRGCQDLCAGEIGE